MGLMKKLTSALVASSLVFSLVGTAFAGYTLSAGEAAGKRMQDLKIVQGRPEGLALNADITRAELVTIVVRAFGKENDAKFLKDTAIFPDIKGHWAAGNIAMAVGLAERAGSDPIGMADGTFAPDKKLTAAEAVAFLMKFVGLKAATGKVWPDNFLSVAAEKNLITAEDAAAIAAMKNEPATRGLTFYLFDRAFYEFKLADGATFYTKYVDSVKPTLTVTEPVKTTIDSKITISGKATGASKVYVGSTAVTLGTDGAFSFDVNLTELKEYPITVRAEDVAGNFVENKYSVTRTTGDANTVEAKLAASLLKAGTETALTVVVKDKNGVEIKDAAYDVKVEGAIGTFAAGKFTAAAKPATGKLVITSGKATASLDVAVVAGDLAKITVDGVTSAKIGQAVTFAAKGFDAAGNEVTLKDVTWTSTKGGVINPLTGEFAGTTSGTVTVAAKVGTVSGEAAVAIFGDAAALKIDAPTGLIANAADTKTVTVRIVDASGTAVKNATNKVTLTATGGEVSIVNSSNALVTTLAKDAVNGEATFTLKGNADKFTATTTTLSATAANLTGDLSSVTSVKPTVGKVVLTKNPDTAVAEVQGKVTIDAKVLDTTGAEIAAQAEYTITLATTYGTIDNTSLVIASGAKAATTARELTLPVTENAIAVSGSATNLTVEGFAVNSKVAGPAYKMVVVSAPVDNNADKGSFTVKVAVQDGLGTTKTSDSTTVVTATAKQGTTEIAGSATVKAGIATIEFRPNTNADNNRTANGLHKVGAWTISFASGTLVKPEAVTVNVTPGAAFKLAAFSASPATVIANGTHTSTLSVEVQDKNNNLVPTATNSITFARATNNNATVLPSNLTVNAVGGKASIVVTAGVLDGAIDTFSVTGKIDDTTNLEAPSNITVTSEVVGVVANMALKSVPGTQLPVVSNESLGKDQTAGTAFKVSFNMIDARGKVVSIDAGRVVTIEARKAADDTVVDTQQATTANGVAEASFTLNTVGNYYFKAIAPINGNNVELSTKDTKTVAGGNTTYTERVVVKAAAPKTIAIVPALTSVETGTVIGVTVTAKDAHGNNVAGLPSNFEYAAHANRLSEIDGTAQGQNGTFGAKYTAINTEETFTIADVNGVASWTPTGGTVVNDLVVTPATVSTYIAGPAYKLGIVANGTDAAATSAQTTVKIGVYDGTGKLKTTFSTGTISLVEPTNVNNPVDPAGAATQAIVNGIATFTLTGANKAGAYTFEATHSGGTLVKATGIGFNVTAGTAHHVAAADETLTADGSSIKVLSFKVVDSVNDANVVTNFGGTMKFTVSGTGATLLQTTAPIVNGVAQVTVRATTQAGTFVVTGAVEGSTTVTQGSADVVVSAGAVASIAASGTTATKVFVLKDQYGNAIAGTKLTYPGANNTTLETAASDANGIISHTFTQTAQVQSITLTANGVTVTVSVPAQ